MKITDFIDIPTKDTEVTEENCMKCGEGLPEAEHAARISFLQFCDKCQYNYPTLLDWGLDKTDGNGRGRLLHGYHETIMAKKRDKEVAQYQASTSTSYSPKKKKRGGNMDWIDPVHKD